MPIPTSHVVMVLCFLVIGSSAAPTDNDDSSRDLDKLLADTETQFKSSIDEFFWAKQKVADSYLNHQRTIPGCALKTLSNWATTIEYTKYALRKKALQSVRAGLSEKTIKEIKLARDESLEMDSDLARLLVLRADLRALTDGLLIDPWRNLYWYIETFVFEEPKDEPLENEVLAMAKRIHGERHRYSDVTHLAYINYTTQLEFCSKKNGINDKNLIQTALDKLIDDLVGCPECSEANKPDPKTFHTYPLFSSPKKLVELTKTSVDQTLLEAVVESSAACKGKVPDLGEQMLEIVGYEDILDQEQDLMRLENS